MCVCVCVCGGGLLFEKHFWGFLSVAKYFAVGVPSSPPALKQLKFNQEIDIWWEL